jgi:hypothetical protein
MPKSKKLPTIHLEMTPLRLMAEHTAAKNEIRAIELGERLERIAQSLEGLLAVFGGSIRLSAG